MHLIAGENFKMNTDNTRNLIIHIGDPKTGTSSIQRALQLDLVGGVSTFHKRKVSGFVDNINSANAISFARSFQPEARRSKSVKEFERWVKKEDADFLIISSEFFSRAEPELLRRYLADKHANFSEKIKIIAYVRPHVGRALSAFTERTKAGYTLLDFDSWLGNFIRSGTIHYAERFIKWRTAFGDNFILRPYIRNELLNQDVLADFFSEALGAGNFSVEHSINENQKISLKALAGLQGFNRFMSDSGVTSKRRIPMSLMISRFLKPAPTAIIPQIGSENIERIVRACRKDANQLDQKFFVKPLFIQDLKKEKERLSKSALDLSPDNNFNAFEKKEIEIIISNLEKLLHRKYERWLKYYKTFSASYNVGQFPVEGGGQIQTYLTDLAKIFSE